MQEQFYAVRHTLLCPRCHGIAGETRCPICKDKGLIRVTYRYWLRQPLALKPANVRKALPVKLTEPFIMR